MGRNFSFAYKCLLTPEHSQVHPCPPQRKDQLPALKTMAIIGNPIDILPKFIKNSNLEAIYFDWSFDPAKVIDKNKEFIQKYINEFDFKITKSQIVELFSGYDFLT